MVRMGILPQPGHQNNPLPGWLVAYLAFLVTIVCGLSLLVVL